MLTHTTGWPLPKRVVVAAAFQQHLAAGVQACGCRTLANLAFNANNEASSLADAAGDLMGR